MRNETSRFAIEQLECRRLLSANPAITISDVAQSEGQSGATAYTFTVSLSKPSSKQVSVNFATENGSAQAGQDYAHTFGKLNFARGQTSKTVTVMVNGDVAVEENETFSVKLRHARNAFIADDRGIGTIVNDDVLPPAPPPVDPPPYELPVEPYVDYGGNYSDDGYGYWGYYGGYGESPSY
jgi:hypothetical protein